MTPANIFIILACVPLYVANSFCDKHISSQGGNKNNILYNSIKFLMGSLFFLPMVVIDDAPKLEMGVVICGVACGMMYAVSKTVILKGYEKTSVAFMTLCHASGMIVPCVIGHFFWSEKLGVLSVIGILLAVISIVLLKDRKADKIKFKTAGIVIGIVVFLTSGGVMIAQKLMGLYFAGQSISAYNFYSFIVAFFILCFFTKPKNTDKKSMKSVLICAMGSAVSLSIISIVMTKLAGSVPSVVLFPLFNGLGIIFVCIGSVFAFKEKLSLKKVVGLLLGVCGLCLVNL